MWNLDSLYQNSLSDEFIADMKKIQEKADLVIASNNFDEKEELYRDFYKLFNKAMTYCNLRNMDTDECHPEKNNIKSNLTALRNIYSLVSSEVQETSKLGSILKPSSDLFTDFYYSSLRKYKLERKNGADSEQAFSNLRDNAAHSLIGIKRNVQKLSELEGYSSPLEKALKLYQITEKAYINMIQSMETLIPYFKEYFKNHTYTEIHSGKYANGFASENDSKNIFSFESGKKIILESLDDFSPEAFRMTRQSFSSGWIDTNPILSDPLCINIPSVSEFRIKLDYKDDLKSLISLAHELGHGYHGFTLYKDDILNFKYPLSIGETSALFFEDLVYDSLFKKARSDNNLNLLQEMKKQYISNISLFTMDVYARYLFEKEIYETIKSSHTSSERISDIMKQSLVYVYGNIPEINENLWIEKSHFYNFSRPYYNIPYIFGLFIEKLLVSVYKFGNYSDFPNRYTKFFSNTNKLSIHENMQTSFDLDIEDATYWDRFNGIIIEYLNKNRV